LCSLGKIGPIQDQNDLTDRLPEPMPMDCMTRFSKDTFFHLPLPKAKNNGFVLPGVT
tara:strand:+ start:2354 stop:2524 length:171 start_codon:yes stop_codon:yes gene_type:complete